jgi:hypothetical protein
VAAEPSSGSGGVPWYTISREAASAGVVVVVPDDKDEVRCFKRNNCVVSSKLVGQLLLFLFQVVSHCAETAVHISRTMMFAVTTASRTILIAVGAAAVVVVMVLVHDEARVPQVEERRLS